jgi:hypothetical protein
MRIWVPAVSARGSPADPAISAVCFPRGAAPEIDWIGTSRHDISMRSEIHNPRNAHRARGGDGAGRQHQRAAWLPRGLARGQGHVNLQALELRVTFDRRGVASVHPARVDGAPLPSSLPSYGVTHNWASGRITL